MKTSWQGRFRSLSDRFEAKHVSIWLLALLANVVFYQQGIGWTLGGFILLLTATVAVYRCQLLSRPDGVLTLLWMGGF